MALKISRKSSAVSLKKFLWLIAYRLRFTLFLLLMAYGLPPTALLASVQQEVYITGHVQTFGGYKISEAVAFEIQQPGKQEIGRIGVEGLYNGEYPWVMRVYTDNLNYSGVGGAVRSSSPAGLISSDGQFVIPLYLNCPNLVPANGDGFLT